MNDHDFDMQAAWLRRFSADAESNLKAFALRLKEAMPDLVTVREQRGFFSKSGRITGLSIDLGENRYTMDFESGRLKTAVSMIVRGITLNTKDVAPADWFARLYQEAQAMTAHAESLSRSLTQFMAG